VPPCNLTFVARWNCERCRLGAKSLYAQCSASYEVGAHRCEVGANMQDYCCGAQAEVPVPQ
jgi:hypothetical protein